MAAGVKMSPRDLRLSDRSAKRTAQLAAVSQDDIEHARQQLRRDSPRLAKILDAEPERSDDAE